ncbi:MAG: chemotaxis response regulator protein-glutamate methylesterase [Melioribacteraceae bacterium]|nr:chemotaxis response regulator protein-glutamate methylesterase [Melioribacteraceae bacterium]
MTKNVKVLIVDDSRIYRGILETALKTVPGLQIVGSVRDGYKALEFIKKTPPDIVTLDVEMDEMDGLETLKEIQKLNKKNPSLQVKVIMVSSHTTSGAEATIKSLEYGAIDFIPKPSTSNPATSIQYLKTELGQKLKAFGVKQINTTVIQTQSPITSVKPTIPTHVKSKVSSKYDAILIGISTGGPKALAELMPTLTNGISLPILIVQHMPATFTKALADSLNPKSSYTIKEATDNETIKPKHAYIAPGGKHMIVRKVGTETKISITDQPAEEGCKPSANIMFRSAATAFRGKLIALVLTGMGSDGTKGLAPLKRAGTYIIAQDQASSTVWGMPSSAINSGNVTKVEPLNKIADAVLSEL